MNLSNLELIPEEEFQPKLILNIENKKKYYKEIKEIKKIKNTKYIYTELVNECRYGLDLNENTDNWISLIFEKLSNNEDQGLFIEFLEKILEDKIFGENIANELTTNKNHKSWQIIKILFKPNFEWSYDDGTKIFY